MHSVTHDIGSVFQPIFHAIAWLLAELYDIIPNYAVAIALLTIIIMGVLTPLTVKSTKSMMAMQRLQPEIKKLQQKYKGPENRQLLNEEMMKLYREEGVNPVGGCLPMLLQAPFLFILYNVIKGLSYTVTSKSGVITPEPRYIPHSSKMYDNLIASLGHIKVWGMDLSLKPFSSHSSALAAIPFFVFVAIAVGLQYFQMAQMNNRSKKSGTTMPSQQQTMQRILPIIFAYFYLVIPAAVVLYMIISTLIRIITQDLMFRAGISNPQKSGRVLPAGAGAIVDSTAQVAPTPSPKPSTSTKSPNTSSSNGRSKTPPRPSPKPQAQPRSRAKRKRKAR